MLSNLVEIFYYIDEFCKEIDKVMDGHQLTNGTSKGYISQSLFEKLFIDNIQLITKIKKNMKNALMHLYDKIVLRKRALIETVNDLLKNGCQIEHTRHRCLTNFIGNLVSGLIAYNLAPKKPALNIEIIDTNAIKKVA